MCILCQSVCERRTRVEVQESFCQCWVFSFFCLKRLGQKRRRIKWSLCCMAVGEETAYILQGPKHNCRDAQCLEVDVSPWVFKKWKNGEKHGKMATSRCCKMKFPLTLAHPCRLHCQASGKKSVDVAPEF